MPRLRFLILAFLIAIATAPHALADVVIGIAGPTDGPGALTTRDIARAVKTQADRLNRNGGVLGERIGVVEADDGCAQASAEMAARKLSASGATLILGHPCASAAIAAAKVYAQAGIIFMATATRHATLTNPRAGPTIFRFAGRDDRQGASAGAYLARTFPGKPIAIVRDQSRYGEQIAQSAASALKTAGTTQIVTASVSGAQKDFTAVIAQLTAAHVEAVLFAGFPIEAGLLLRQLRTSGLTAVFIGSDALATDEFATTAGDQAGGVGVLLPSEAGERIMRADQIAAAFPGETPSSAFLLAYAAVEAWHAAADAARSTGPAAVVPALQTGTFDTIVGMVSFDANGDAAITSYDVVWWKDGTLHRGN
jgi:branched-chain amino acid transport system substrate-binding protein